jgi:hypothetical protein
MAINIPYNGFGVEMSQADIFSAIEERLESKTSIGSPKHLSSLDSFGGAFRFFDKNYYYSPGVDITTDQWDSINGPRTTIHFSSRDGKEDLVDQAVSYVYEIITSHKTEALAV